MYNETNNQFDNQYNNQVNPVPVNKRGGAGVPFLIFGIIFLMVSVGFHVLMNVAESKIPKDAKWYKATISEIVSCDEDYDTVKRNGKKVKEKEYDYEYILKYDVEGTTHEVLQRDYNRSSRLHEGDIYYVRVTVDDPERIYTISSSPDANTGSFFIIFYVVSGVIILLGIVSIIRNKKQKKQANMFNGGL